MSTKPIEHTAGLSSKTQLSASEVQALIEASLDPALMTFSQRSKQLLAVHVVASHLIFRFFHYVLPVCCCLRISLVLLADGPRAMPTPKHLKPAQHADQTCGGVK